MVGYATAEKLYNGHIKTIGDLAHAELTYIQRLVGMKLGQQIHNYARGVDDSTVLAQPEELKGYGNSTTLEEDVTMLEEANRILLVLTDNTAARMRTDGAKAYCISVTMRGNDFKGRSHQRKLPDATDVTEEIYDIVKRLFSELWDGRPLRLLGVSLTDISREDTEQFSLFEDEGKERSRELDKAMDSIRGKYGMDTIMRASSIQAGKNAGRKHKA